MSTRLLCCECVKKQEEIYRLRDEIKQLNAKLRYEERKVTEGYFGAETPSSKRPFKSNGPKPEEKNKGGAKKGHQGYGRQAFNEDEADSVERVEILDACPDCGQTLESRGVRKRAVIDVVPVKVEKILYELEYKHCTHCRKSVIAKAPGGIAQVSVWQSAADPCSHRALPAWCAVRATGTETGDWVWGFGGGGAQIGQNPKRCARGPSRVVPTGAAQTCR